MPRDFRQIEWDEDLADDCRQLIRLAIREDLERQYDWTTVALVPPERVGAAAIVARKPGIVAGMPAAALVIEEFNAQLALETAVQDGERIAAGARLGTLRGNVRDLLTVERTLLNLVGRLMGVATLTGRYVAAIASTKARVYDTRKTTPGWRRLEKYAVRCGGGTNHRLGLYDAMLIKDNHLAQLCQAGQSPPNPAAAAVRQVRAFLAAPEVSPTAPIDRMIVEVEVDSLAQLEAVLAERPDIVLLDNMNVEMLQAAVALRDRLAPGVELEASGGVTLDTIAGIAATGVERISAGALTHSAVALDVALDWLD